MPYPNRRKGERAAENPLSIPTSLWDRGTVLRSRGKGFPVAVSANIEGLLQCCDLGSPGFAYHLRRTESASCHSQSRLCQDPHARFCDHVSHTFVTGRQHCTSRNYRASVQHSQACVGESS